MVFYEAVYVSSLVVYKLRCHQNDVEQRRELILLEKVNGAAGIQRRVRQIIEKLTLDADA
jgi:hypothetical protein